jgi:lipid II:glycine glycyltransferase (peptidoglycan interpeptide bridge formation enzyme)
MKRVGADDYYYFSDGYFDHICRALFGHMKIFATQDGDETVAAALFLLHGERIHYHLGGSDACYLRYGPNNLLFHEVALWGLRNGFRYLHLGGGRTPDPDDSLFRFKASISRLRFPFYIGKRIHDREVYDRLCAMWMQQAKVVTRPNYFLLYRLEGTT